VVISLSKWKDAKQKKGSMVKFIEKLIPAYGYSDKSRAEVTDEKFCELLTDMIREMKDLLFNIINTGFESHKQILEKDFVKIRDELDIFSDEIKARHFVWDRGISQEWMEKIISYDFEIIRSTEKIRHHLNGVFDKFLKAEKPGSKMFDEDKWKDIKKTTDLLYGMAENLAILFKERDTIANIKKISLDRTFDSIRKRLRTGTS
jgi:hypothetical protein